VAILQFKFDESYDHQILALGGWIATELEWERLEGSWKRYIDDENERSEPSQQITRYHATEMNCKGGEFKYWSHPKCIRFSRKLIKTLAKRKMGAIGIGCNMPAIQNIWPNGEKKTLNRRTYILCMKSMMVDFAHIMEEYFAGDRVILIHDHNDWDQMVLEGYDLMVNEPQWEYGHLFAGIVSKSSKDPSAIGLQAADMIAYEIFKGIKAKTVSRDAEMRAVMKEFLDLDVPLRARWIDEKAAKALYQVMKDSGKYPDLDNRGVA
jgi:hypothetical protein